METWKKVFRPEFLNRVDETIVFRQLSRGEIKAIARHMLKTWAGWRSWGPSVTGGASCWPAALPGLRRPATAPRHPRQIEDPAAELLLSGGLRAGGGPVDAKEGRLSFPEGLSPSDRGLGEEEAENKTANSGLLTDFAPEAGGRSPSRLPSPRPSLLLLFSFSCGAEPFPSRAVKGIHHWHSETTI